MQPSVKSDPKMTVSKGSAVLKYYNRFEPLAEKYAKQIFQYEKIGFELEDLIQEFKLKIYTAIIKYASYYERKKNSSYKPWPIELYVKKSLQNRVKDFIKLINQSLQKSISIEQDGFDYSMVHSIESHIVITKSVCKCEINGVDLLEGLNDKEARCFILFLRGFHIQTLQRLFKNVIPAPNAMIKSQIEKLQAKKDVLLENSCSLYLNYFTDSEN